MYNGPAYVPFEGGAGPAYVPFEGGVGMGGVPNWLHETPATPVPRARTRQVSYALGGLALMYQGGKAMMSKAVTNERPDTRKAQSIEGSGPHPVKDEL